MLMRELTASEVSLGDDWILERAAWGLEFVKSGADPVQASRSCALGAHELHHLRSVTDFVYFVAVSNSLPD